jgi:protoporphyrinogen oxidase
MMGGISRTENYRGNRIDIGGHRFFSKSQRIMKWWLEMLPIEPGVENPFDMGPAEAATTYPGDADPSSSRSDEQTMLVRNRKSRIFFLRKFFDYPIRLKLQTIRNLGLVRMCRIMASYAVAKIRPIKPEQNLEQFFINRFGRQLYRTFFQSYTEKVWGVPCDKISAEWGAQRIKGLSITKTLLHALSRLARRDRSLQQSKTETSLIERFLYPRLGPGQMWETCADQVRRMGGEILTGCCVERLLYDGQRVEGVVARDTDGETFTLYGDYVFSSMPVKHLLQAMGPAVPPEVRQVGDGLVYRDFVTVGVLTDQLEINDRTKEGTKLLSDNWIYIQEPDVTVGRLQIFNNWSPYLVRDPQSVWLGMEYFCNEGDELWSMPDEEMKQFGVAELAKLGFIKTSAVRDAVVIRVPKAYPAYFGTYRSFDLIREFVDSIDNLFLVGRNGMHRYNNQDHSMLTAMVAVDNIMAGRTDKSNIWEVNTESEYHEESETRRSGSEAKGLQADKTDRPDFSKQPKLKPASDAEADATPAGQDAAPVDEGSASDAQPVRK